MTEGEWLACEDPTGMLEFLRGKANERKSRLFALAILTTEMAPDTNREYRSRIEIASRFADGSVSLQVLREHWGGEDVTWPERAHEWASELVAEETIEEPRRTNTIVKLLREIFGYPFRPISIDPSWLTPTVTDLARAAYDERALPSGELDPARLGVLSDALEEAGCDDEEILAHLRSPGPHVRGCWVVDLILGKE